MICESTIHMGCLLHPKTRRKVSHSNFWGLRSLPSILRHLIHDRYLEEGELQKEQQQQVLGIEETQPPAEEGAVKPNTEAQVGNSLQQGLGTLGRQQLAEVRLSAPALHVNRSCVLLFLAKSIPAGIQCQIFSAKERRLDVSVGWCWQT